ncbi:hypothetical protein [Cylindrospermopsis raciborskii]|jgi:hypothetical protein|uniref:hypothetical protein n=1 Tax=Cylindrospermopsis raciborskii TaxID=77022 RepID=UPI000B60184C|nr:hypothetical protein [Cylindrospermopsis raciborskii]TPX29240.1 hypothetical protein FIV49_02215 [Cylindrospermopsis raciborskii GIHE 2018]UJL32396.1 hypothetical protein C6N34_009180 [Cylindrospermopsis raciborskii Cr2010]UJS04834.1 hypothetical protein L3I90_00770 [Cylindrospermopsis raciborskii KLL07]BAZ91194.1 hypothetical protein NIES932_27010 [Raphidiopsis curvata NIES-932]
MKFTSVKFCLAFLWLTLGVDLGGLELNNRVVAQLPPEPPEIFPLPNNQSIPVLKSEFGVRIVDGQGKVNFFPTTRIPLKRGDVYGWRITLENYRGQVKWREVLRLPKAPETWITQDKKHNFSLGADGTTAITRRTQMAKDGVIENYWQISPGDPLGQHKIEVYVDDSLITTFEFETVQF